MSNPFDWLDADERGFHDDSPQIAMEALENVLASAEDSNSKEPDNEGDYPG